MVRRDSDGERHVSTTVEDYLKAIAIVQQATGIALNRQIAAELGDRTPASVTGMVQRLAGLGLVVYTPHRGVRLTEAGERIALRVIRHHRLIGQYLVETLGLSWAEVQAEADRLEHVISDDVEGRIAMRLTSLRGDTPPAESATAVRHYALYSDRK